MTQGTTKAKAEPKNVSMVVEGDKLVITVDLSQEFGLSKSGKTTIVASTAGEAKIGEFTYANLNVYKKAAK